MSAAVIQLLVLAGIAIFLILRLRSVLGTREGFEKPPLAANESPSDRSAGQRDFEVIDGGVDHDITDHAEEGSAAAEALAEMKRAEPGFSVSEFLQGARGAYEMILMGFEHGDLDQVAPFLSPDVFEAFSTVLDEREAQGLLVDANFVGVRELSLQDAAFDAETATGEITVRFQGELTSVVRNTAGEIVEGNANEIKRQRDVWTFARKMGTGDPNWQLVATGG
ncbi:putative lipid-binding transport protein (Tim44 family) [Aliiruegeria haliotis]|uniref:Putative lipid-binding transport protein (Tim44 family) n=1 Tax=Aliiruegeria haliotis TaxID=1280846 RepID=A0A2T0RHL4_9RHOB|nr:Tim44/TimA family putative adaptor protein [Aliiruegeria haliotis]PRY20696.1 putative lipid-binding transport protein (Tim44 family) [Aliiruegeria haliotis]